MAYCAERTFEAVTTKGRLTLREVPVKLLAKVDSWRGYGAQISLTNKEARQLLKYNIEVDVNGCWLWKLKLDEHGYALLPRQMMRAMGLTQRRAHAAASVLWKGQAEAGIRHCHTCDVRRCCSPRHLWQGTQKENMQDAVRKGRMSGGNNSVYGKPSHRRGKQLTEETKAKMRAAWQRKKGLVK